MNIFKSKENTVVGDFHRVQSLSWALVIMFFIGFVIVFGGVLVLGGVQLFQFLWISLIQAFGLAMAVTASLFFLLRLVWRLKAVPMGISMLFFIIGISLFVSVSVGRVYALQYPIYVESFGPGSGPGLPMKNVITFFQHIDQFESITDIARDPRDVPAPITVLDPSLETTAVLSSLTASGTLMIVSEDTEPEVDGQIRELYLETTEVLSELAPGITFNYWTFNNTVPGPMFRVREGDIVRVTIKNSDTSLHHHNVDFHAATGPGGGGAVTMIGRAHV